LSYQYRAPSGDAERPDELNEDEAARGVWGAVQTRFIRRRKAELDSHCRAIEDLARSVVGAAESRGMNIKRSMWWGALTGFYKPDIQGISRLDRVSLFLYAARSVILVISAQAAIIAGLLAAGVGLFEWGKFIAVLAGFVAAHMISNLSNDYFGFTRGHDTPDSPRMRYTVHPFASGILDSRTLLAGLSMLAVIGLGITTYFVIERGWMAAAFAVAGVSLLFLYDAAPTPLKSIGLGEFAVLLVWGPLMIGGGFAMITGQLSANAMFASLPYGLGVMTILVGKHIDQMDFDSRRQIRTLPVLTGEPVARALNIAALVAIYGVIAILIGLGRLTPFAAVVVIAVPRAVHAIKVMSRPRPLAPPDGYVGWPLWCHRACLQHNRAMGWAYIGGLAAGAIWHGPAPLP
jgi:1,4-dihydroxy-2-naphthoate polyprenyltransferase